MTIQKFSFITKTTETICSKLHWHHTKIRPCPDFKCRCKTMGTAKYVSLEQKYNKQIISRLYKTLINIRRRSTNQKCYLQNHHLLEPTYESRIFSFTSSMSQFSSQIGPRYPLSFTTITFPFSLDSPYKKYWWSGWFSTKINGFIIIFKKSSWVVFLLSNLALELLNF